MDPRVHGRARRLADVAPSATSRELPADRIATVVGRYYAMDRDQRWERTERALAAILLGEGRVATDPSRRFARATTTGVTDEFVEPIVLDGTAAPAGRRHRRSSSTSGPTARASSRERLLAGGHDLTTMTRYRDDLDCPVAFAEDGRRARRSPRCCPAHGLRQLHAAETEKYAHVTYFFNGGREEEWPGETRILVPSPARRPSYDHKPEMSAREVARALLARRSARATRSAS